MVMGKILPTLWGALFLCALKECVFSPEVQIRLPGCDLSP
ncbi:MAG: hypothetical protein PWP23_3313 [Candidatus Sumerlaeota bacterium]|nr:hypothetical protein [Candidatus Sumerlaeota bacterium]